VYTEKDFAIHKADKAFSGLPKHRKFLTEGIFPSAVPPASEGGGGDGWGGVRVLIGDSRVAVGWALWAPDAVALS